MLIFKFLRALNFFLSAFFILLHSVQAQQPDSLQVIVGTFAGDSTSVSADKPNPDNEKKSTILNSLTNHEINIKKGKTSFRFNYGARIQTRFDYIMYQEPNAEPID